MAEIEQCTAEQVVDTVEALTLANRPLTPKELSEFVNHPLPAIEQAASVGQKLGLLDMEGERYVTAAPYDHYFREASESHRIDVLRFAVEAFHPYRYFKQRLALHGDALRAARETRLRFDFTNHETEIQGTFLSLGQFSGSLMYSKESGYRVAEPETVDQFLVLAEALSATRAYNEDFIRDRLGTDAYAFIQDEDDDIITHLRGALGRIASEEADEGAVVLLGNACENFLVKLANEANPAVDLDGAMGIISKAERLRAGGVIAQKHMGYMGFLGQLRNAADHGIDDDVNLDWAITPDAIRLGALLLLGAIKSVVALNEAGRAEF